MNPYFFENQYIEYLHDILNYGEREPNRTGIDTLALWGAKIEIPLANGFPIITTRKTSLRIAFEETWFFLRGETDTKKLEEKKINIWKGNTSREFLDTVGLSNLPSGSIGAGYSHCWRNFNGFVKVDNYCESPFSKEINIDYSQDHHGLVGKTLTTDKYGDFTVIKETVGEGKNRLFTIQFHNTGAQYKLVKQKLLKKQVKDTYAPRVLNRACIGDISLRTAENKDLWQKLHNTWASMLSRCYNPNDRCFKYYGEKNVYVSTRWLTFSNFFVDVQQLHNWDMKLNNWGAYSLDKDYTNKGYYSGKTCRWATNYEQRIFSKPPTSYKGVDQVAMLLEGLKNDPTGRRHIITGWNPQQTKEMALPPCHLYQQYRVTSSGKLNSSFMMRSWDFLYGAPFNIMGYALLNHAFAKYLKLEPGLMVAFGNDVHLYENQLEIAREQIQRTPFVLPKLTITKELNSLDDILNMEYSDLLLEGYEAHPDFKNKPKMAV